jgi:hypothetical protein
MATPWEVLLVAPTAATIIVEEDIDGLAPCEVVPVAPAAPTTEVEEDVDGGPPGRCCW